MQDLQIPDPDALPGHVEWRIAGPGADAGEIAAALAVEDGARGMDLATRDRFLAGVHAALYGPRIEATRTCTDCGEVYDLDFDLRGLVESLAETPRPACVTALEDGSAVLASGHRVRAPGPADSAAVAGLGLAAAEAELLARCVDGSAATGPLATEEVEATLEWLAPILDIDLEGTCPECGATERLRFSIEHYLARSLQGDRGRLLREVHLLASSYRWSFDDILRLGRRDRRALAALAENDRSAARAGGWS